MLSFTLNAFSLSSVLLAGGLGVVVVVWAVRLPSTLLALLPISLVAGQVIRAPFPGQGGGVLLSDFIVALLVITAVLEAMISKPSRLGRQLGYPYMLLLVPFLLLSAWQLAVGSFSLDMSGLALSLAYLVRLISYLLVLPVLLQLLRNRKRIEIFTVFLDLSVAILLFVGFAQVILLSDLSVISHLGWDPHQSRLVSTWLDPNFLGGLLVVILPFLAARIILAYEARRTSQAPLLFLGALLILSVIALVLTKSRSSIVALGVVSILLSPIVLVKGLGRPSILKSIRAVLVSTFIFLLVASIIFFMSDRLSGLLVPDATVNLRAEALKSVWPLAADNSLIGPGYNAYQFQAKQVGLIDNFQIHSRAGADNSLLTIWVTSGLGGLFLFLVPWAYLFQRLGKEFFLFNDRLAFSALASLAVLVVHSQFINSLLYGHLLLILLMIIAITIVKSRSHELV